MSAFAPLPPPEESVELVRRIQAGDESAWERLYLRFRDRLLLSIRCRLGARLRERLESEDILHSMFRDALSDVHRFVPQGPASVNRYLHACVLNKIRSKAEHYGAQKRTGEVPLSDSLLAALPHPGDSEPRYSQPEVYDRLEAALARLPEETREVILLRLVEDVPNQDVAAAIGKSPEAASKMYQRGLARLGVLLSEPGA